MNPIGEQPWHSRHGNTEHHERYRQLMDLHALTLEWLKDLKFDPDTHLLPRGVVMSDEIRSSLWMLESFAASEAEGLESLFDDTLPEDVLGRLEQTVSSVQAWTLANVLEKTAKADRSALLNQLEQSSWRAGRRCAERSWAGAGTENAITLSEDVKNDARGLLACLRTAFPGWNGAGSSALLIRRAVPTQVQFEWLACPHQSAHAAVPPVADNLCALQAHWIRGYLYALNTRVKVEHSMRPETRCIQKWDL